MWDCQSTHSSCFRILFFFFFFFARLEPNGVPVRVPHHRHRCLFHFHNLRYFLPIIIIIISIIQGAGIHKPIVVWILLATGLRVHLLLNLFARRPRRRRRFFFSNHRGAGYSIHTPISSSSLDSLVLEERALKSSRFFLLLLLYTLKERSSSLREKNRCPPEDRFCSSPSCRSFFYCVKFSSVEKERELCRARSPSFRFSTKIIIVGNLLMKRDSHTKGHPSKSSPPLFDGGGGFFEHTQHRKTKVVLSRDHHHHHDHGPSSRVCAPSRCSKAHTFFVRCLGLFFYPIK